MSDPEDPSVAERLDQLEAALAELREAVRRLSPTTPASSRPSPSPRLEAPPTRPRPRPTYRSSPRPPFGPSPLQALMQRGPEFWISRVGIGLLLVGLAFLFRYAVDKGWLTPWIRVLFGLALGGTLATIGLRVAAVRRRFSQIVLGGASATWYMTGFAAFQFLDLVSHPVAFAFMVAVTVFTFWASVQHDGAVLALVGAVGGLTTPFMLYTETGTVPDLVWYTLLLITGTCAIYLVKGWRSLLWITAIGGWLVLTSAVENRAAGDPPAIQAGLVVFWLLFWLIPVVREVLAERNPSRWPRPAVPEWATLTIRDDSSGMGHLAVLVLAIPLVVLALSRGLWSAGDAAWGVVSLIGAIAYWSAAWYLRREDKLPVLVSAHRVVGAALAAIAAYFFLDGHTLLIAWAALGVGLHVHAKQGGDQALRAASHVLFGVVAVWLAQRLVADGPPDAAVLNTRALADLGVIAVGFAASWWLGRRDQIVYRLAAHIAVLAWLWRELATLTGGNGVVTTAWGLYGLAFVVFLRPARRVGLATMFAAVAKLVLYDLTNVDGLWRILLFLSFGGAFLALGYYVPALWKTEE